MNNERIKFLKLGIKELPNEFLDYAKTISGENGEIFDADEAGVWKRVLDYRLAKFLKPKYVLETHSGKFLASKLYELASPESTLISMTHYQDLPDKIDDGVVDFVDVDPYGLPYDALKYVMPKLADKFVISITNGEIVQVTRKLKGVYLKSNYSGKDSWKWVENIYIPYLEKLLNADAAYFYIFPTSVRVILSKGIELPSELFEGCEKYMWWIKKYAHKKEVYLI